MFKILTTYLFTFTSDYIVATIIYNKRVFKTISFDSCQFKLSFISESVLIYARVWEQRSELIILVVCK